MYEQVEKPKENKSRAVANAFSQKKNNVKQGFGFEDNRSEAASQRKFHEKTNNHSQEKIAQCQVKEQSVTNDQQQSLNQTTLKLKALMNSALADGWSEPGSPESKKLSTIISFLEGTSTKSNDLYAENVNTAIGQELSASPLGMEIIEGISNKKSSERVNYASTIQQSPAVVQRIGAVAVVTGVIGLGTLIGGIYQFMRQGVTSQTVLLGQGPNPGGGLTATVHAQAQLTSPSQYVEYDIRWTAGAVPGGVHLGQVPGTASPGWVRDKEATGVWGIGDRNYANAPYIDNTTGMYDNLNGTHFNFNDHIQQPGLVVGAGTWGFRLRVYNRFGILLRSSEVPIVW